MNKTNMMTKLLIMLVKGYNKMIIWWIFIQTQIPQSHAYIMSIILVRKGEKGLRGFLYSLAPSVFEPEKCYLDEQAGAELCQAQL